jgi:hypothetical protein
MTGTVKLTRITKEAALHAPISELPNPARNDLVNELLKLARGTPREAEIAEWVTIWPVETEVRALIAELKTEREERKRKLPTRQLEVTLRANTQSNQRALERAEEQLARAQAQRDREAFRQIAEMVNHQAIEQGYAQREWDALAARRYDPMGLWGTPTLASGEDW